MSIEIGAISPGVTGQGAALVASATGSGPPPVTSTESFRRAASSTVSGVERSYVALSDVHETSNRLAHDVRAAEASLSTVSAGLATIRSALTGIVKHYPPYPIGSPERTAYLYDIAGFRRRLEAILVPGLNILPVRVNVPAPAAHDPPPEIEFAAIPALSGADLRLPELAPDASDAAVEDALTRFSQAEAQVSDLADAVHRTREEYAEALGTVLARAFGLIERTPEESSTSVRRQLAKETDWGLTSGTRTLPVE